MARRFFRKFLPSEEKMRQSRALRVFGKTLLNRRLWHLNRHSTAWGVASGLFWAWIALPVQTIAAVAMAIACRGNVALAAGFTWISNPLTWVPCFLLSYYVGQRVTGTPPIPNLRGQLHEAMSAGPVEGISRSGQMLMQDLPQIYPLLVGGVVIGAFSALIGYSTVKLTWRWNIVRRWHHRHDTRRKLNPAQRLTSGFAHIYRMARRTRPAS